MISSNGDVRETKLAGHSNCFDVVLLPKVSLKRSGLNGDYVLSFFVNTRHYLLKYTASTRDSLLSLREPKRLVG